jgi:hypothetical protein
VDADDDAELLGTPGCDDGLQQMTANSTVVVAGRTGWLRRAIARPELSVTAARTRAIPAVWSRVLGGVRVWRERGRRAIYGGGRLGVGVRVRVGGSGSDGGDRRRVRGGLPVGRLQLTGGPRLSVPRHVGGVPLRLGG